MTALAMFTPAPVFTTPSIVNPRFAFSSVAGRFILMVFLPEPGEAQAAALQAVETQRQVQDFRKAFTFLLARDQATVDAASDKPGAQWLFDLDHEIARKYNLYDSEGAFTPGWLLLDPTLRLLRWWPLDQAEAVSATLAKLPMPEAHAGVPLHAPVLIVPRIFEPDLCRRLIAYYEQVGGAPSGTMQEIDGRTVGVLSSFKSRRDADINDEALKRQTFTRISARLIPEIERAFMVRLTRMERFIVACYDAAENGHFKAHRDNTTPGTAHRMFAVSINLNSEEFEGGNLRFPEFGPQTYRPPTGGAVVFGCSLLHEATPITRGKRYAFLPFLYDDAGAELRMRAAHTIVQPKAPEVQES